MLVAIGQSQLNILKGSELIRNRLKELCFNFLIKFKLNRIITVCDIVLILQVLLHKVQSLLNH
jgi:hypothetical protein